MDKIFKGEIQRLFPIFEAIKKGKTIQWYDMGVWRDIDGDDEGFFLDTLVGKTDGYRIKPEPKYRPFANTEECWAEMLKHQPLGWLYEKENNYRSLVTSIYKGKKDISINGISGMSLDAVMKYYTFVDGTPFGIKIKE